MCCLFYSVYVCICFMFTICRGLFSLRLDLILIIALRPCGPGHSGIARSSWGLLCSSVRLRLSPFLRMVTQDQESTCRWFTSEFTSVRCPWGGSPRSMCDRPMDRATRAHASLRGVPFGSLQGVEDLLVQKTRSVHFCCLLP